MFRSIRKFAQSPTGRSIVTWLAPIVVGWIVRKLTQPASQNSGRKRVKNKVK